MSKKEMVATSTTKSHKTNALNAINVHTCCKDNIFVSDNKIVAQKYRAPHAILVDDRPVRLGRVQWRFLQVLLRGGEYNAAQLSDLAHVTDPRGKISELLAKSLPIRKRWCTSDLGTRWKLYSLDTERVKTPEGGL